LGSDGNGAKNTQKGLGIGIGKKLDRLQDCSRAETSASLILFCFCLVCLFDYILLVEMDWRICSIVADMISGSERAIAIFGAIIVCEVYECVGLLLHGRVGKHIEMIR